MDGEPKEVKIFNRDLKNLEVMTELDKSKSLITDHDELDAAH